MLNRVLMVFAVLTPSIAAAADLPVHHRHVRAFRHARVVVEDKLIQCSTTELGLITFSNCGQSFDPFSVAAGR